MAEVLAFLGILLTSLLVGILAALQLADFFRTDEEFILVAMALAIFAVGALALFALVYTRARRSRTLAITALDLVLVALVLSSMPILVSWIGEHSTNPFNVGTTQNIQITLELLVPAVLIVLVQWGLVRRRWLRGVAEEDLTRWPWITTAVAGLAILNPLGLAIVSAAFRPSVTDWLQPFWTAVTGAAAVVLIVMVAIECYIRGRMLRRRMADSSIHP
jgi:hypothetical protein